MLLEPVGVIAAPGELVRHVGRDRIPIHIRHLLHVRRQEDGVDQVRVTVDEVATEDRVLRQRVEDVGVVILRAGIAGHGQHVIRDRTVQAQTEVEVVDEVAEFASFLPGSPELQVVAASSHPVVVRIVGFGDEVIGHVLKVHHGRDGIVVGRIRRRNRRSIVVQLPKGIGASTLDPMPEAK